MQGLATALHEDVQVTMLRTIAGLEHCELMRPGYAIEYDCLDPLCLTHTLAVRDIDGLFAAGQVCGSSGYEEAAAQGLVAGANACLYVQQKPPFTLSRMDGYIGTLVDDLVTKGTNEPYRMMTSRSEYRLVCRQDNADLRLMAKGHALGLISDERMQKCEQKREQTQSELVRLRKTIAPPSQAVNDFLRSRGSSPIQNAGASLHALLRRPELDYDSLSAIDEHRPDVWAEVAEQVEVECKYEGYISRQMRDVCEMRRLEDRAMPDNIDYQSLTLISVEARQKLAKMRPKTLGQASRISGVSPADVAALMVVLSQKEG